MMLCRSSRPAMAGGILAMLFVGFLLLREHSPRNIAIWVAMTVAITIARYRYQENILAGAIEVDRHVVNRLLIGIAIHGAIWSLPSTWLVLAKPDNQVVMGLILVGLSANALISLAPLRFAYTAFIGAMMLPIAIMYFWIGDNYATSAIGIVAYLVVMVIGWLVIDLGMIHFTAR